MDPARLELITTYVNEHIDTFHEARLAKLSKLKLSQVLKRKNPYLFRAKNVVTGSELIESLLRAYLSSSEEELFGEFLEGLAIFVSELWSGGRKSSTMGLDLELDRHGIRYIVAIKSGPNWGNSSQYRALDAAFKSAVAVLSKATRIKSIQPVLGMCYGRKRPVNRGLYLVLCGQHFWEFISGEPSFYLDVVKPIGYRAKDHNDAFEQERGALHNRLTGEFIRDFCDAQGRIDWAKLVQFNSGQPDACPI